MKTLPSFLGALVLLFPSALRAATVQEAWVQRFVAPFVAGADDEGAIVACDSLGDVIATGTTSSDILTIKYSGTDGRMLWQRRSDGSNYLGGAPHGLVLDRDGNVIIAGHTGGYDYETNADWYIAKYAAADGAILWERTYNGPANSYDAATALALDANGNVVVTGISRSATQDDFLTAKFASTNGARLWERRYDGPAHSADQAAAVAVDASGQVVVTGWSRNAANEDFYTAKYDGADGALLWERRYDGPAHGADRGVALGVDASGNVLVAGESWNGTNLDYYTAKYSAATGSILWEKRYNGPADRSDTPRALVVDADGNGIVTGGSEPGQLDGNDCFTIKYAAADGAVLWEARDNGPFDGEYWPADYGVAVALDAHGNVLVTGQRNLGDRGTRIYTAKYAAADGHLLWGRRSEDLSVYDDYAKSVAVDANGDVVVAGIKSGDDSDFYTAKYAAADGAFLWQSRHDGPAFDAVFCAASSSDRAGNVVVAGRSDSFMHVAKVAGFDGAQLWAFRQLGEARAADTDAAGNVFIAGAIRTPVSYYEQFYVAKLDGGDGAVLWDNRLTLPVSRSGNASALKVDGDGDVLVTGHVEGPVAGYGDAYTAKYSGATGALLWEHRYDGPARRHDEVVALALDSEGNVAVTGWSVDGNDFFARFTAKYAASNGASMWIRHQGGAPGQESSVAAVATDHLGNVIVTGSSQIATNWNFHTVKYAAATGAVLWERFYDGPVGGYDWASAVAVDAIGNVVVAGSSFGATLDGYTAKYAAADGALLWERRFDGPANEGDTLTGMVTDTNGDVIVTGNSEAGPGAMDSLYSARYASGNGAILWEKHSPYQGWPRNLVLVPGGGVVVAVTGHVGLWGLAYDMLTIKYVESPAILRLPAGYRVEFPVFPGRDYSLQRAPSLNGPWSDLQFFQAPASGRFIYTDAVPLVDSAFYRAVVP